MKVWTAQPRPKLRKFLLFSIFTLVLIQGVLLMPSTLERPSTVQQIDPEILKPKGPAPIAPGVPTDQVPDYVVETFEFVSTVNGQKQWKLIAEKAYMYNSLRLVHTKNIKAFLYNPGTEPTIVTGKEAKYMLEDRNLEVFGDVLSKFPDGFHTESQYLHYTPNPRTITIPEKFTVTGESEPETPESQTLWFRSLGMNYPMDVNRIHLLKSVEAIMRGGKKRNEANAGVADETKIKSDQCTIERNDSIAHFTMYSNRPLKERFVQITQPNLFTKGRRADIRYGDLSGFVHYMTVFEDAFIQELKDPKELRYGTGGRADFDSKKNLVRLSDYPQVYQDHDTLVGDVIIMHRDTDIVEVENGNGYSTGNGS
jgi:LPS export ABC transporter protein LptC